MDTSASAKHATALLVRKQPRQRKDVSPSETGFPAEKSLKADLWKETDTDRCSNVSATTDCHDPCRSARETLQGSRQSLWHRMLAFTLRTVLRRALHGMALRSAVKSSLLIFRGSLLLSLVASLSTLRIAPSLMCVGVTVGLGRSLLAATSPLALSSPQVHASPALRQSRLEVCQESNSNNHRLFQYLFPLVPFLPYLNGTCEKAPADYVTEELECILDLNAPLMTIEEGEESPEDLQAEEDC
eukprot:g12123.t1